MSASPETHRDDYYERLLSVTRDGDWTGWCRFLLAALKAPAGENQQKAAAIVDLYERMKREAGVLRVLVESSGRRTAILYFPASLNIVEGRDAF